MSQENVEIVRRGYELYAAGDLEGVTDLISDAAELPDAGGLGVADTAAGTRHGRNRGLGETLTQLKTRLRTAPVKPLDEETPAAPAANP